MWKTRRFMRRRVLAAWKAVAPTSVYIASVPPVVHQLALGCPQVIHSR